MVRGDFDNDGDIDLAGVAPSTDQLIIFLNDGHGGQLESQVLTVSGHPFALACAEFTGDGILDLAVTSFDQGSIALFSGVGNGGFTRISGFPSGGSRPLSLLFVDLDDNGTVDLLVGNSGDRTVTAFAGDGQASFEPRGVIREEADASVMCSGRLDENNLQDILIGDAATGFVRVLSNTDNFTFLQVDSLFVNKTPSGLSFRDVNNDGWSDIVATATDVAGISLFLRSPDGLHFLPRVGLPCGLEPNALVVEDLNGDTTLDIAVSSAESSTLTFYWNDGPGIFTGPVTVWAGIRPAALIVGGVDESGAPDIHWTTRGLIAKAFRRGAREFSRGPVIPTATRPSAVTTGDLNSDGRLDLVIGNAASMSVSIRFGNGDFTFSDPVVSSATARSARVNLSLVSSDSLLDLVTLDRVDDCVLIRTGLGGGLFTQGVKLSTPGMASDLLVLDVTGDHLTDVVVSCPDEGIVSVFKQAVGGEFPGRLDLTTPPGPFGVTAIDTNGDSRMDLVVACTFSGQVCTFLGSELSFLSPPILSDVGAAPNGCRAAQGGSGQECLIVTTDAAGDWVTVLIGNGNGTFSVDDFYPTQVFQAGLSVVDVTGDQLPDIVVGNTTTSCISVLAGEGQGRFSQALHLGTGGEPTTIGIGDFNGDKRTDLVTGNQLSRNLSIIRGIADETPIDVLAFTALEVAGGVEACFQFTGDLSWSQVQLTRIDVALGGHVLWTSSYVSEQRICVADPRPLVPTTEYWLSAISRSGRLVQWGPFGVSSGGSPSSRFSLSPAWPNPSHSTLSMRLSVEAGSEVRVQVFSVHGSPVATLIDGWLPSGIHEISWDWRGSEGQLIPVGTYFVRAVGADGSVVSQKLLHGAAGQ